MLPADMVATAGNLSAASGLLGASRVDAAVVLMWLIEVAAGAGKPT